MTDPEYEVLGITGVIDNNFVEIRSPDCDIYIIIEAIVLTSDYDIAYSTASDKSFKVASTCTNFGSFNIRVFEGHRHYEYHLGEEIPTTNALRDVVNSYLSLGSLEEHTQSNFDILSKLTRRTARDITREIDNEILRSIEASIPTRE